MKKNKKLALTVEVIKALTDVESRQAIGGTDPSMSACGEKHCHGTSKSCPV